MILVTVGTQLGFDRLIRAMDQLQPAIGIEFVAQIGSGRYRPKNMRALEKLSAEEFNALAGRAALIVSHAGVGTILAAQRLEKPIVIMPRLADRGEHRNDHQRATVKQLAGRRGIFVAEDEYGLPPAISKGLACGTVSHPDPPSIAGLISEISRFVSNDGPR